MNPITPAELAAYFDHTQLRAYAQRSDFEKLCAEAREYGFAMVAINPAPVSLCKDLLAGTSVHVGAAVGFPLGQSTSKVKKYETVDAIANGADEIDLALNQLCLLGILAQFDPDDSSLKKRRTSLSLARAAARTDLPMPPIPCSPTDLYVPVMAALMPFSERTAVFAFSRSGFLGMKYRGSDGT